LVKLGNRAPLFEREVTIVFAHCNTLSWCCTSFVSSGGPLIGRWPKVPRCARDDTWLDDAASPINPTNFKIGTLEQIPK
jgi:hypothetical protein